MGTLLSPGADEAKKTARDQRTQIARQKQLEQQKLAEEEGDIERRKAATTAGRGGRSLLVATKQDLSKTLGG